MADSILAIVGPTASGKTVLGLAMAREQNGEIISVDSRQVYRYLSIGTAKPEVTDGVPHHLIDFLEPNESFSAAEFVKLATAKVAEIRGRGKTPIFVGGTGLYFKALTEGLATLPTADLAVRGRFYKEAEKHGRQALHQKLASVDPEAASAIPANNIQRVIRALEVYELTGKPITRWHKEHHKTGESLRFIGLDPGIEELHRRIAERCQRMLKTGMIEETQAVLAKGVPADCPALSGLGYPRVIDYLSGRLSKEDLLALLIQDTRQYAKRQRTWFRNQFEVTWKK